MVFRRRDCGWCLPRGKWCCRPFRALPPQSKAIRFQLRRIPLSCKCRNRFEGGGWSPSPPWEWRRGPGRGDSLVNRNGYVPLPTRPSRGEISPKRSFALGNLEPEAPGQGTRPTSCRPGALTGASRAPSGSWGGRTVRACLGRRRICNKLRCAKGRCSRSESETTITGNTSRMGCQAGQAFWNAL